MKYLYIFADKKNHGDDSNTLTAVPDITQITASDNNSNQEEIMTTNSRGNNRPKRNTHRPKYLSDFV